MAREINLVPTSKFETIKAIRLRNFLLFLCIAVAGGAIAVVFVLGTILGGQGLALSGKDNMLKLYSEKINSYSELTDFLTIKDQLGKLSTLADNKTLLSRTFGLLPVFIPANGDEVSFSKISLDFNSDTDAVAISIEAQADALNEPYIDYNVLDAFKKAMDFYRYDYGTFVNELGDKIPAYCIIENDMDGSLLNENGKLYAYWTAKVDGCDPRHPVDLLADEEADQEELGEEFDDEEKEMGYDYTLFGDQEVVKIWRTPQFDEWYEKELMSLDGTIDGVPHFESECISYHGEYDEVSDAVYFSSENNECKLIANGVEGFTITDSSNGRNKDDELILSFKGVINIEKDFYKMRNTHMMAIAPSKRYNVTDSYTQIQSIFVAPANPCDIDDEECRNGGK